MTVPDELRHELWAAFTNGKDVDGWHFSGAVDDHWTAGVDRMIPILTEALAVVTCQENLVLRLEIKRLRAELHETKRRASDMCARPDGVCLTKVWEAQDD